MVFFFILLYVLLKLGDGRRQVAECVLQQQESLAVCTQHTVKFVQTHSACRLLDQIGRCSSVPSSETSVELLQSTDKNLAWYASLVMIQGLAVVSFLCLLINNRRWQALAFK